MFAAFATRMQGFAFIDRSRQTSDDERRERQGLPGFRFVVPKVSAHPGHIDFEQAMDHGLAFDRRIHDLQYAPEFRIRDHLVLILPCVHRDTFPLSVGPSDSLPAVHASFEDEKPATACRSI